MRIALMLTGLARKVQEGYDRYWKHIINNHDVDLYLHGWYSKPDGITNNEDSDDVLRVYSKHGPKYLYIQNPFPFTEYREGISSIRQDKKNSNPSTEFDVYGNFRCFPMFYSWESTYKQIQNSGAKYQCVIRSRYDISGKPLDLYKIDLEKINVASNHWKGYDICDDNLLITNQQISDKIFSNIFVDIVDYHKKTLTLDVPEKNFTDYLKRNNLHQITVKSQQINFSLLRDTKLWF
jgi:hypothetical protein